MVKINVFIILIIAMGTILIGIATYLSTVEIPKIDDKIRMNEQTTNDLNGKIERGILFSLNYRQNEIKKRLNFLELNNLTLHNAEADIQQKLKQRVLNEDIDLIKAWSNLWKTENVNQEIDEINNKLNTIIMEKDDFEAKKNKLEALLNTSFEIANNNLQKIQAKRDTERGIRIGLDKSRELYFKVFVLFQVVGLIILSISTILEKLFMK